MPRFSDEEEGRGERSMNLVSITLEDGTVLKHLLAFVNCKKWKLHASENGLTNRANARFPFENSVDGMGRFAARIHLATAVIIMIQNLKKLR